MLRLMFAVVLIASPAFADDAEMISRYSDLHSDCRLGETVDGRELSDDETEAACKERDALGKQLTEKGYCWSYDEYTWEKCPLTN